jgi:hypothetical protein
VQLRLKANYHLQQHSDEKQDAVAEYSSPTYYALQLIDLEHDHMTLPPGGW